MIEQDKIKQEILIWIDENRHHLPLNVDCWEITIFESDEIKLESIEFGKYKARVDFSQSFSKPYSKIFVYKNG